MKKQLNDLSAKVGVEINPIFTSKKLNDVLRIKEKTHGLVNQQNVVYSLKCDLCEAGYVGYMWQHLHQSVEQHKTSAVGTHYAECHGNLNSLNENFKVLKHCTDKLECLIYEMLYIKELKSSLNKQNKLTLSRPRFSSLETFILFKCSSVVLTWTETVKCIYGFLFF